MTDIADRCSCEDFERACRDESDGEGYGSVFFICASTPIARGGIEPTWRRGEWACGYYDLLPPVKFCPWCGKHPPLREPAFREEQP